MIKLSNRLKYLPRFRFEYTPYGPELVYQNYFKLDDKLFQLSFSHSDGSFDPSWRITGEAWNIYAGDKLSFNLKGQLWNQPAINYFVNDEPRQSYGIGSQLITAINYDFINERHKIGSTIHIGYKTRGYSLGEQLENGIIIRGGLSFRLVAKKM